MSSSVLVMLVFKTSSRMEEMMTSLPTSISPSTVNVGYAGEGGGGTLCNVGSAQKGYLFQASGI